MSTNIDNINPAKFMTVAYGLDTNLFSDLAAKNYSIPNASNVYISDDKRKLCKEKEIDRSGIYYESSLVANTIVSFIGDLMVQMNLETKEYTKSLFSATDYPAIANKRTDNMGNSTQKRYRAKSLSYQGTDMNKCVFGQHL